LGRLPYGNVLNYYPTVTGNLASGTRSQSHLRTFSKLVWQSDDRRMVRNGARVRVTALLLHSVIRDALVRTIRAEQTSQNFIF
jgi:hypothetical protein